ncbi:J domain-containing protein [Janthinobacterium sp. PLB04]|uniref:J domain-containing protein n=1 Tax=Janthinobacterium lividum TaxID=29581 RepID=A0AAJ4T502_9BURK|nr:MULTISPECIES: J domain-containing protein [Janthinobacterium]KAB0326901.1 J domain-containing protein [Janthinobacterium lividum]QSX96036.1 J domain-containing protein [Janthinobacterium lividum]UGQ35899.1 J domain-containing protein [Janthinobacterium sp. PLB04]
MDNGQRSLWAILGTEPTGDERTLKRAYAKRLKVTRPEDDPAAFQELREAYEYALRHAHLFAEELPEPPAAEAEAEAPEAPPMEPADLWGVIDEPAQEPPAELWGVIAQEQTPPPEQWGVVAIDPAQEADNLWQGCLALARHADAGEVLARILQDDAMLNLDVREEFDLCALRYCASAGYKLPLRQALFEQLGWDHDFSYLARSHADLVRGAVQRYRADRSFAHFSDNRDSYPGLDCIMSQQPPSAYARQLFDQKFNLQLRELLHAIRWQHGEMLAYKLDTDLFEQWEQAVHAKRYFKQTALASGGLGFVLHFMLAGVLDAAGFKLGDTAAYASLLGFQALAFALLAMHALRWPAPLFARFDTLQEALQERLPTLWQRPGLRQLGWIVPYLVLALLLFLPERSETMRLVTAAGLCASALLAYAMNRQLLHGMLLLLCLGLSLFAAMFMSGKGPAALAIGEAMPLIFCLAALALRSATGLYGDCGFPEALLPRLRAAWLVGCAGLLSLLYVQQLPAALVGAALYAWSCAGLLFSPTDFKWKTIWPVVLVPSLASFVLAGHAPAIRAMPMMHNSVELALAVLYLTLRYMYLTYGKSFSKPGLS